MLKKLKEFSARELALYCLGLAFFALPISTSFSNIFYVLTLVIILASGRYVEKYRAITQNPIGYWLLGYALLLLMGALYSAGTAYYIKHDLYKHLWVFVTPLLFWLFQDERDRYFVLQFFLAAMVLVMILSYLKFFGLIPALHFKKAADPETVFQGHISQAFFMAFAGACWFYFAVNRQQKRWLYSLLALLAGANILFLNSGRTGLIVYVVAMLFLSGRLFGVKYLLLAAPVLIVGMSIMFYLNPVMHQRVIDIRRNVYVQKTSVGLRAAMYQNGWQVFKKRPWFGYGTGGFSYGYGLLPQSAIEKTNDGSSGWIHYTLENSFLNIMIEYGVVGLLFLLGFVAALWYYARMLAPPYVLLLQSFILVFFIGAMGTAFLASDFSKYMFSIMVALGYGGLQREAPMLIFSRLKLMWAPD